MQTSKGYRQGRLCISSKNFRDGKMQLQKLEIPLLSDSIGRRIYMKDNVLQSTTRKQQGRCKNAYG
ncbi:hypothetical protein T03_12511 [Trichinella britovi]|uniref:Uncharacterized protein n=1 Tax=Trichinella britovi TaxID=45882 RepID=A0A0V1CPM4_TRIBR|nr:hypothetical protein T03_12511 [Trichinella britovi]